MEKERPKTSVGNNGKHGGVTANHYESTIRDLNETVYRLYRRIEELIPVSYTHLRAHET